MVQCGPPRESSLQQASSDVKEECSYPFSAGTSDRYGESCASVQTLEITKAKLTAEKADVGQRASSTSQGSHLKANPKPRDRVRKTKSYGGGVFACLCRALTGRKERMSSDKGTVLSKTSEPCLEAGKDVLSESSNLATPHLAVQRAMMANAKERAAQPQNIMSPTPQGTSSSSTARPRVPLPAPVKLSSDNPQEPTSSDADVADSGRHDPQSGDGSRASPRVHASSDPSASLPRLDTIGSLATPVCERYNSAPSTTTGHDAPKYRRVRRPKGKRLRKPCTDITDLDFDKDESCNPAVDDLGISNEIVTRRLSCSKGKKKVGKIKRVRRSQQLLMPASPNRLDFFSDDETLSLPAKDPVLDADSAAPPGLEEKCVSNHVAFAVAEDACDSKEADHRNTDSKPKVVQPSTYGFSSSEDEADRRGREGEVRPLRAISWWSDDSPTAPAIADLASFVESDGEKSCGSSCSSTSCGEEEDTVNTDGVHSDGELDSVRTRLSLSHGGPGRPTNTLLLSTTSDEEEKAQTDGSDEYRGPSRRSYVERTSTVASSVTWGASSTVTSAKVSGRVSVASVGVSRYLQWRHSRILDLKSSELLAKAAQVAVDGSNAKAMHPDRAKCGYKILMRMKQLIEDQNFDDSACRSLVEKIFFDSIPRKHVEIKSIEQVLRVEPLKRFLKRVADEGVTSVEACWHGTQEKYVAGILDAGLNPSLCNTGAYGRGAYVGTHAGVAHQYADPGAENLRHMCLVLVVVGNSVVKGEEGHQSTSTACDRLVNPTQYCFVDEDRLYCSHLITYTVPARPTMRTGGGWEDPYQRKLMGAIVRAAKIRNKDGLR